MKICNTCGVEKPLSEFYKRTEDNKKYMAECKPCRNIRSRKNYRDFKSTKDGHATSIFNKRKRQAKYHNIPFTISLEYMLSIPHDNCAIFDTPLRWSNMSGKPEKDTPSIDKIIPELGYIEGNVQWVSYKANSLKSNGKVEDFLAIVKYLQKHSNNT